MNTPQVNFSVTNETQAVSTPVEGVSFFRGKSLRGPFDKPDEIFSTWAAWVRRYGGLTGEEGPINLKRYFDKGGKARFSREGHYTTITDRTTLSAVKATASAQIINDTEEDDEDIQIFALPLKYQGADYNNISVIVSPATNNVAGYFNIDIVHALEPSLNESYRNLFIEGTPTIAQSNYLREIIDGSELVDVQYFDLSLITTQVIPTPDTITYAGGTNGGAIIDSDIIGDSASKTGFYSFNEVDDSYQLMVIDATVSNAVHTAGHGYAAMRQDLQYWAAPSTTVITKAGLIAFREATGMNTKYGSIFGGGLNVLNPSDSQRINIEGLGDIAALAVNSEVNFGPWYSFAGNNRGVITNALGVVNNFGTPGSKADLNELANRQVNMIINRDGQIKLWGGFTTQVKQDSESFNSMVRLVFYIKKALRPTLEGFLEEPTDIPTFLRMYYVVKPFFESLVNRRALVSWDWQGDQFAKTPADFQINKAADVALGKYKIRLVLVGILGMQEIQLDMYLTNGGTLTFDVASN